ncbi:hypothetical protein AC579_8853 [Pseudocercospora musae]|uniref:LNR domain-containing protein n=1 Tax=Pseudocercospora musae TaxID=113226 RepID=A0A139IGQ4_9PEZI|nr:hypothetical protein AC579_8853 [Pseudocercospora musae]
MLFLTIALLAASLATVSFGILHNATVCVKSPHLTTSNKDYGNPPEPTKCACEYYHVRNTGDEQWDKCPDCSFDGFQCNPARWHIGGDEVIARIASSHPAPERVKILFEALELVAAAAAASSEDVEDCFAIDEAVDVLFAR